LQAGFALGHWWARRAKRYRAAIAAEVELLRLRALPARQGKRAAFGVVRHIFVLGVLVLAEVVGWQVLRLYVGPISATLILSGINLVIAALFGVLSSVVIARPPRRRGPGSALLTAAIPVATTLLRLRRRRNGRRPSLFG
jgi:hypothetical protein